MPSNEKTGPADPEWQQVIASIKNSWEKN